VLVGFFASGDSVSHATFTSVAEAMREDFVFGITNNEILAEREQINLPAMALYKAFDDEKNIFGLTHGVQAISTSIMAAGTPFVPDFHPELHQLYVDVSLDHHEKLVLRTERVH
jgi:protein disulfide-isomerase A1